MSTFVRTFFECNEYLHFPANIMQALKLHLNDVVRRYMEVKLLMRGGRQECPCCPNTVNNEARSANDLVVVLNSVTSPT